MPKKYRSDALAAIHETMEALHDVGAINKQTMCEFDETCLTPVHTLSPRRDQSPAPARAHLPASFCALPERLQKPGFRLGARRQKTGWPGVAPAGIDPEKRAHGDCLMADWR